MSSHEIVVLGGNFAGVTTVHNLLRSTVPTIKKLDKSVSYHVTLVTPNSHYYFKLAAPRLVATTKIPQEKIWRPLSEGFKNYSSSQFTLVQGLATSLDSSKRVVTVTMNTNESRDIRYDSLIIATGTTTSSPLWTLHKDENVTIEAIQSVRNRLPEAKTVLIAGGGPVGVETAGEIASNYPSVKVSLLSGTDKLLSRALPSAGASAETYLRTHYSVDVIHNVRVASSDPADILASSDKKTSTTLKLTDGTTRTVDIYIDATGGAPNSSFLPQEWLDSTKRVLTRDKYFRVKGGLKDDVAGVYTIGDIVAGTPGLAMVLDAQVATVISSLAVDIAESILGSEGYEKANRSFLEALWAIIFGGGKRPKQAEYKPMENSMVVPIGRGGGVGALFGWKLPNWFIDMVKGKSYLVEMAEPMVTGSKVKAVA